MADSKNSPRNNQDEYLPDAPASHSGNAPPVKPVEEGITPENPSSMPRAEDDEETQRNSPEFHDRPGGTH